MIAANIIGRAKRHAMRFGWLAGGCLVVPGAALAADESPPVATDQTANMIEGEPREGAGERSIYLPEDFAQYGPRTALDMLQQVPGFTIDDPQTGNGNGGGGNNNNQDTRGLGQASGNVLLNGARFTSKSDAITDQLARIAAEDVVRIELVDGATLDIPGLSGRIANVIALNSEEISGQFEWKGELRGRYAESSPKGFIGSISGSTGRLTYLAAFENDPFNGGAEGYNIVTYADGTVENRSNGIRPSRQRPKVSGTLQYDGASGWVASLGGSYHWEKFNVTEPEFWTPASGGPQASEIVSVVSPEEGYEINGELGFGLGPGRLTLIGLFSKQDDEFAQQGIIDLADGNSPTGTRFEKVADSSEKILRAEYGWGMLGGDWQLSAEGAYNALDQVAVFGTLAPTGEYVLAPFAPGTGKVTEDRYEALLFHGRPLTGSLTFQVTAGGEYSKIAQTGSNALARTFLRPKGSVGLAWGPAQGTDISLRLSREVGQLDFDDFLGQVNIGDSNTNAGNNELRPEQKWVAELELAKNFGGLGSATLTFFGNKITDYVTIVPLENGRESIGNIPSAKEYGVNFLGTLRFDELGMRGGKLDIDATIQESSLTSLVTGESRGFDRYEPINVLVRYRHDFPGTNFALGGEYEYTNFDPYYRVAEFGFEYNRKNDLQLFIEHKDLLGLTVNFGARNLLHGDVVLERVITDGPRDVAPFLFSEDRRREVGTIYTFSVKGSF